MSHRLGSVSKVLVPRQYGPDSGDKPEPTDQQHVPDEWRYTFSAPSGTGEPDALFLMLHFTNAKFPNGNHLSVDLGYDIDVFTDKDGPDFWTRPIAGSHVNFTYINNFLKAPSGSVTISEFARAEPIKKDGALAFEGGNSNGDVFFLRHLRLSSKFKTEEVPFQNPSRYDPGLICPVIFVNIEHHGGGILENIPKLSPKWEDVESVSNKTMRDTARSVGMIVSVHTEVIDDKSNTERLLSTCSAAVVGPDLLLTAGHCFDEDENAPSASFTLDFETNADGTRKPGYSPRFFKVKEVVYQDYGVTDFAIVRIDPHPGLGVPPLSTRLGPPNSGEEVFAVHHPRGAPKKISRRKFPNDGCAVVQTVKILAKIQDGFSRWVQHGCDVDYGSSGSPLLDIQGRIIGVNTGSFGSGYCANKSAAIGTITARIIEIMGSQGSMLPLAGVGSDLWTIPSISSLPAADATLTTVLATVNASSTSTGDPSDSRLLSNPMPWRSASNTVCDVAFSGPNLTDPIPWRSAAPDVQAVSFSRRDVGDDPINNGSIIGQCGCSKYNK